MIPKVTGLREAEPFVTLKMAPHRPICMKATVYVGFVQVGRDELARKGGFVKVAKQSLFSIFFVFIFPEQ